MRKNISHLLIVIGLFCLLSSCEKVIELKLKTSSSHINIQGNIYDQDGSIKVKISTSIDIDKAGVYPAVTGASVTISDNIGNSEKLTETIAGTYVASALKGVPGRTYHLSVIANGEVYTATSTMPNPVKINSLYFENSVLGIKNVAKVKFNDPANVNNYYRLVLFVNNIQRTDIYVADDKLNEGKEILYWIMSEDSDKELKSGDKVTIWLETIDKGVYDFFRTSQDDGQSASPANPISNISNGSLGYFNACSVQQISSVVP